MLAGDEMIDDDFGTQRQVPRTAAEAAHGEMQKRNASQKKSAKIDYSVLESLFGADDNGSAAASEQNEEAE